MSAYFAPLVAAPTIIDKPGQYVTRCGETVSIHRVSAKHDFGCRGTYQNGIAEGWHRSGRIMACRETANDVVGHAAPQADE